MQTLFHSTTSRYTLAPTRNVGDFSAKLSKCTGKSRKSAIRDLRTKRDFPKFKAGMSTADYVKMFEAWGTPCKPGEWEQLNEEPCTLYSGADTCETLPDEFATWEEFDAAQCSAAPESTQAAANDDAAPTVPDPEPAAPGAIVAADSGMLSDRERAEFDRVAAESMAPAWSADVNGAVRRGLDRTPIQHLPNYARMAIERADADSGLRSTAKVSELVRAYAATYGAIAEEWEIASALYICGRRFWDFDAAPDGAPVAAPIETAPAEVAPPHYAIGDPLTTQSDARAPVDGERFRILERSRATYDNLWTCAEVSTARRAADVAQSIIAGWTGGERWAVCADSGAFLYGIGADGKPMSAAPVCAPVDPLPTQSDSVPVPGKLDAAPVRPDYPDVWAAWRDVCNGRADPDIYQARVIECMDDAIAGGLYYNSETYPAAARLMAERYGYPDARTGYAKESGDASVASDFGIDCYNARAVIRQRAEDAADKAAADGFQAGQKFARLMFSDYKLCTGAVLHSLTHTGKECRLTGKRAGRAFEFTCTATALQNAIERAAERARLLKEQRERDKPAPMASAPVSAEPVTLPSKSETDPVPSDTIPADNPRDPAPVVEPYRYARGAVVARCKSPDDFKTRAARLAEHCRMRWVRRAGGYVGTVRQSDKLLRLFAEGRDASVITGELYPVETAEPAPCKHPPARLYAGHANNADGVTRPWVACCDCGDVLTGGAPSDADEDDETIPAPLDGLDVAELDGLAEFERAGGEVKPTAPAYRDDAPRAAPDPCLRIPDTDPRIRIPARFAPVYLLQA